jgi:hypothetical protein
MSAVKFGIIGAGWRAEFYLRIARALPERFEVAGAVVRNPEKRLPFQKAWGVKAFPTLEDMLAGTSPGFVVTAVSWDANPGYLRALSERGMPALSETPPAPDLEGLVAVNELTQSGARIQVAEQYWAQPHHAARLAVARSGMIGRVTQAQISACHGYHGISLMRRFLSIGYESPKITAKRFVSPLIASPDRDGLLKGEQIEDSVQDLAWFDFGHRLGVFDFSYDQYFSWVRSERVLVRGERGEIINDRVHYLKDFQTPIVLTMERRLAGLDGNLEGSFFKGIQLGDEWIHRNPFAPASLTGDEIAIASCLDRMDEYVRTGRDFYPLAEASQDHYLNLLYQQAIEGGHTVQAERQPWAQGPEGT